MSHGSHIMGLALLFCFSWSTYGFTCLPGAIPVAQRRNVSVDRGTATSPQIVKIPLAIANLSWASGALINLAAKIVVEERVGVNAVFGESLHTSSSVLMVCADCNTSDASKTCFPQAIGSGTHLGFEVWESYTSGIEAKLQVEAPGQAPLRAGSLGAEGTDAYFITQAVVANASQNSLFLRWHESYNLSLSNAYTYFASHSELPIPDTPCDQVFYMRDQYLDYYVSATGDTDYVLLPNGQKKRNCHQGWARSPACRTLMQSGRNGCIPGISFGGWGYHYLAQFAYWFDIPLAIGSFWSALYTDIPQTNQTIFYWWTPDSRFTSKGSLEVVFPAYDPDEHANHIYKTSMKGTPLLTISSAAIANDLTVQQFASNVKISIQSFMSFVNAAAGQPASENAKIACQWLQNNNAIWKNWVPDPTQCVSTQGIRDSHGTFITNTSLAQSCDFCPPGRYSQSIQTAAGATNYVCRQCETGRFQAISGRTVCTACLPGRVAPENNTVQCNQCPPGSFQEKSAQTKCTVCAAGNYSSKAGESLCSQCSLGYAAASPNATACMPCPVGYYQDATGSDSCVQCPPQQTTQSFGAVEIGQCQCIQGTFRDNGTSPCQTCKKGMTCPMGSDMSKYVEWQTLGRPSPVPSAMKFPMLLFRHASLASDPLSVFSCKDESRCPGGPPGTCSLNMRTDVFSCAHCVDKWYWSGKKCIECTQFEGSWVLFPLVPIVLGPSVLCVAYFKFRDDVNKWGSWQNGMAAVAFIIINHFQITTLASNSNIQIKQDSKEWMNAWVFYSQPMSAFKPQCAGFETFERKMIMRNLTPITMAILFLLTYWCSKSLGRPSVRMMGDRVLNIYFSAVLTFFAGIASLSMSLFVCHDNPNGKRTLTEDESVVCRESQWNSMVAIGVCSILLYIVGFGGLFCHAIITAPSKFADIQFQRRWKFLFIKYRPDVWWWSIPFCLKGLVMNLGYLFLEDGVAQLSWLLACLLIYLAVIIHFMPWRSWVAAMMDVFVHMALICVIFLLFWFARDALDNGEANQYSDHFNIWIIIVNGSCLPLAILSVFWLVRGTRREADGLNESIRRIKEAVGILAILGESGIEKIVTNAADWDRFYLNAAADIIQFDMMSNGNKKRAKTCIMSSEQSFRPSEVHSKIASLTQQHQQKEIDSMALTECADDESRQKHQQKLCGNTHVTEAAQEAVLEWSPADQQTVMNDDMHLLVEQHFVPAQPSSAYSPRAFSPRNIPQYAGMTTPRGTPYASEEPSVGSFLSPRDEPTPRSPRSPRAS